MANLRMTVLTACIYLQTIHMQATPLNQEYSPEGRPGLARATGHIIDRIANRFGYTLLKIDSTVKTIHTFGGLQAKHEQDVRAQMLSPGSNDGPEVPTRSSPGGNVKLAKMRLWTWNNILSPFSARLPLTRLTITNLTPLPFPEESTVVPIPAPSPELSTEPGLELAFFDTYDASPEPSPDLHLKGNPFGTTFPQIYWIGSPSPGAAPEPTVEIEPSPDQYVKGNPFEVTFPGVDWLGSTSPEASPEPNMETSMEPSFERPEEPSPSLEPQLAYAPVISIPLEYGPGEDHKSWSSISV